MASIDYTIIMAIFTRNKSSKLMKQHEKLLLEAMQFQRNGKIQLYAEKTTEAAEILKKIEELYAIK